jgi:LEA14-like dessication related protein
MRTLAVLAALCLIPGCALIALTLEAPDVSLVGVELGQTTLFEQHLKLTLKVSNPNSRDITVDGMSFRVEVGERELAHGLTNKTVVLPRLSEVRIPVETSVSLAGVLKELPRLVGGKLSYRLRGEVITHDFGRLPFDRKGELGAAKGDRS